MFPLKSNKTKYGRALIYETSDRHGTIEVVDNAGFRSLHFGTEPKQSEILKAVPNRPVLEYAEIMLAGLLFNHMPKTAYFMGLGAGTIPFFIHSCFPDARLTISETRPVVHDIAATFFQFPVHPNIFLLFSDGYDFLKQTNRRYDMIFIDAFSAFGLAIELRGQELTLAIEPHIEQDGVAVINLWKNNRKQHQEIYNYSLKNDHIVYLTCHAASSGNIVYFLMTKDRLYKQLKTIDAFIGKTTLAVSVPLSKLLRNIEIENNIILRA